ncbi:MAG: Hsp20/alpha crystallin family protein [Peptococcaceae bacterium]|nr:Hsp20/alpha crystallin family protein [Peptococcaceae bacterium]
MFDRRHLLLPFNPFNEAVRLFDEMSSYLPRFFTTGNAVDVYETDDAFVVQVNLPGWNKDDINLNIRNNTLYITGKRENIYETKDRNYYRRERSTKQVYEVVPIPVAVKQDQAQAKLENGVLEVTFPKEKSKSGEGRRIDIT